MLESVYKTIKNDTCIAVFFTLKLYVDTRSKTKDCWILVFVHNIILFGVYHFLKVLSFQGASVEVYSKYNMSLFVY